jgi:hypothetical protein
MKWPDEYWPASPEPPSAKAWDESVAAFRRDRDAVKALATDQKIHRAARIPHGDKASQTYMRAVLLVIDHNAYHVGEPREVRGTGSAADVLSWALSCVWACKAH